MKLRLSFCSLLMFISLLAPARGADDTPPPPPSDNAHARLSEILQRPQFTAWRLRQAADLQDIDATYSERWSEMLKRPFRAIKDFLNWLVRSRGSHGVKAPIGGEHLSVVLKIVAWSVVVAMLIFLAIVLIKTIGPGGQGRVDAHVLSREQVRAAMESGDALALASGEWMDEARRLAAEQDFRAVYRALYLALLSGLHRAGKIEHNRNRTNWAYVQQYRGPAAERDRFSKMTELFDRVWYGRKEAPPHQDLQALQTDVAILIQSSGAA